MVNLILHFEVVFKAPAGVVQVVWCEVLIVHNFFANFSSIRVPEPPLSSRALIVTGLGLPCHVLSVTKTMGFKSSIF